MPSTRTRELIDRLGTMSAEERHRLTTAARGASSAPNPLALRFPPQARVLDLTTGVLGVVRVGDRDRETNTQRFRVQLDDARIVYRTDRELEPAPANVRGV